MGSKVKQKHLLLLQKKVREKLCSLREQKEILLSTINQYVEKAESSAEQLLSSARPGELMERYLEVVQELDRCCDTCLLLTATAEDMIEDRGESKEDIFVSDCSEENKQEFATLTCPIEKDNDDERTRLAGCDRTNKDDIISHNTLELSEDIDRDKTDCSVDLDAKGDNSQSCDRMNSCSLKESSESAYKNLIPISARPEEETQLTKHVTKEELPMSASDVPAGMEINVSHTEEDIREPSTCPNSSIASPCKQIVLKEPEEATSSKLSVERQPKPSEDPSICKSVPRVAVSEEDYGMGPMISHCTITVGPVIPVVVSEIATPWAFYVQQFGYALNNLRASINLYKEKLLPGEATLGRPKVGMVCLAWFHQDENYYRAKIIRVTEREGEELCDVIYLDFGNCETVRSSYLLQLPVFLAELPSQAIFCCLSGVSPMNKLGLWTEDEIIRFREYVAGQQLNCKAAFVSPKQSLSFPHLVDLCLNIPIQQTDAEAGRVLMTQVSVAAILVQQKLARPIPVSEQIAKLQNQFGDLASPSSSKSSSPQKPRKPPQVKKEPDVVVEESVIVDVAASSSGGQADESSPGLDEGHCSGPAQTSLEQVPQGGQIECASNSCSENTNRNNGVCSNLESQNVSEQEHSQKMCQSVEINAATVPPAQSEISDSQSPSKSCASNVDGETTTSGITDMSVNPLLADYLDTPTEEYDVMIAHIVTPNDFYVHRITEDVGKTLNRLMRDLNLHFERQSRKQLSRLYRSFKPSIHKLCCAQFSQDSSYFRAQVVGLKEADGTNKKEDSIGKIHVFYIDFGDSEWLPRSKVFPLPEEFSCFPPLTIWCSLANVRPVSARWTDENINEFERLAGNEKKLSLLVVEGNLPHLNNRCTVQTSPLEVFLTDKVSWEDEEVCINLELMRLKQAAMLVENFEFPTDGSEESDDPVDREWEVDTWDPLLEDYVSLRNSYKVDVDDAGVATVGYKAQDEKRICKYFNTPGRCWRGEYCPFKHVQPGEGVTQDQEYVLALEDDQTDILPSEGVMVAVEITSILSPRHFYLTLPFGKTPIDQLQAKQESVAAEGEDHEETLADLVRSMKVTYQNRSFTHRDILLLAPGQAVAAKFVSGSEMGWYRAKVTDTLPEEDKVEVYFVDFGHTEWVKEGDIHELEPRFLHLPQQAVECFMVGIEPPSPHLQWSDEARERFREMVDGKTLVGQIITRSWSGCLHVDLYDTTDSVDVNIANALIKEGHAQKPATTPIQRREEREESPAVILVPG